MWAPENRLCVARRRKTLLENVIYKVWRSGDRKKNFVLFFIFFFLKKKTWALFIKTCECKEFYYLVQLCEKKVINTVQLHSIRRIGKKPLKEVLPESFQWNKYANYAQKKNCVLYVLYMHAIPDPHIMCSILLIKELQIGKYAVRHERTSKKRNHHEECREENANEWLKENFLLFRLYCRLFSFVCFFLVKEIHLKWQFSILQVLYYTNWWFNCFWFGENCCDKKCG